jgi:Nuclease-related domain
VKVIALSDHPAEMLKDIHSHHQAAADRERAEHRKALARHEEALARHGAHVTALRQNRDRARAERRWFTWAKTSVVTWHTQRRRPRPPVQHQVRPAAMQGSVADQEAILTAGITGEHIVAADLEAVLGDEWTLLHGYRNRRGEIDHVLIGPRGMFTIEVKYRNATVDIDGDQWRFCKYDHYGNMVEQGWITDRRGRSPSVQLNESTAELERFLRSRNHQVRARRVVILTHPRSALGQCRNVTVDLVATSTSQLIGLVSQSPVILGTAQVLELQQLIIHDHRFNQRRMAR